MQLEKYKVIDQEEIKCTGCALCYNLCPKSAIQMCIRDNGFYYPVIDPQKCIDCGICNNVCPSLLSTFYGEDTKEYGIYSVKTKNPMVHKRVSSGGVFVMLSDLVIKEGGIVYGCRFNCEQNAEHDRAITYDERDYMCGSKYVQSNIGLTYVSVGEDLKKGNKVLFSGTPCQVDALHKYLNYKKISEDSLITVDLICHGVPSPKIWQEHIHQLENRYKSKATKISFRKKDPLGNAQALWIVFENGQEYFSRSGHDVFYKFFLKNYHLRPSCYDCKYTSLKRSSDITLGDFGGVSKVRPEFNADHMGVSQVHVNTEKGLNLFNKIKHFCDYFEITVEQGMQPNLSHPTFKPNDYDKFENILYKKGFYAAAWSVSGIKEKTQLILCKSNINEKLYSLKQKHKT